MSNLIKLELRSTSFKTYKLAVAISFCIMNSFTYLIAFIPKIDSAEQDIELFMSYHFIIGLSCVVCMGIFSIMSGVIASKLIIEKYKGKRAILIFSYPIKRSKIFTAKVILSFCYTVISMLVCEGIILILFLLASTLFNICPDVMSAKTIIFSIIFLFCCSVLAGTIGIMSLWFGFIKKSVQTTIISAFISVSLVCQLMAQILVISPENNLICVGLTISISALSFAMYKNLCHKVNIMEI